MSVFIFLWSCRWFCFPSIQINYYISYSRCWLPEEITRNHFVVMLEENSIVCRHNVFVRCICCRFSLTLIPNSVQACVHRWITSLRPGRSASLPLHVGRLRNFWKKAVHQLLLGIWEILDLNLHIYYLVITVQSSWITLIRQNILLW